MRFKAETTWLLLDVTVTDKRGRAIAGFTSNDFSVYEDAKRQDVEFFSDERRTTCWGLVLDSSGRSGSMAGMMSEAYNAHCTPSRLRTTRFHSVRKWVLADDASID
jgi:hypothetical protein